MATHSGHLLVIDTNELRADALAAPLRVAGYQVDILTQLRAEHLSFMNDESLDAVLCEMDLDGVSWDDARANIHNYDIQVPSIMFSDDASTDKILTALRLGAIDYFVRPFDDMESLLNSIDRCVSQRRLRRELTESRARLESANTELRGTVRTLERDQQAGRQVQMRMLPAAPLEIDNYTFSHSVIPSLILSGDFTDYFTVGKHHITFFIADVSGHGSSSAFCTVLLKNLFARKRSDFIRRNDDTVMSPSAMLRRANAELIETGVGKFATMVVGSLDMLGNVLRYSVAGHLPLPVLAAAGSAQYLQGEGPAVGMLPDAEFTEHTIELPESFTLALFSDGILEILPESDLLEKERYFLSVFDSHSDSPDEVVSLLGLDKVEEAPDDIAALFINKRG